MLRSLAVLLAGAALAVLCSGCAGGERGPGGRDVPVVAAGDIAECRSGGDEATAGLVDDTAGTVLALGDNAYPIGRERDYEECYDPSWGRFRDRTRPVPGNHEYYTEGAEGYYGYFGEAAGDPEKGYYSYELGGWHVVALNSNCEKIGGCGDGSPQVRWLEEDLAANDDTRCTLAYFHHPLFTSGKYRPGVPKVESLWEALHDAGADVVLSAHDHNYQRFAPQDPDGGADPERGLRQFVVGSGGGEEPYEITDPIANSEAHNDTTDGVLKLDLRPEGYGWEFVPVEGGAPADSGEAGCHA